MTEFKAKLKHNQGSVYITFKEKDREQAKKKASAWARAILEKIPIPEEKHIGKRQGNWCNWWYCKAVTKKIDNEYKSIKVSRYQTDREIEDERGIHKITLYYNVDNQ